MRAASVADTVGDRRSQRLHRHEEQRWRGNLLRRRHQCLARFTDGSAGSLPESENALIILSDGQAQASSSQLNSGVTLTTTGLYPSAKDECQQAIMAAQAAATAGTTVYSVAYGSEGSGCLSSSGGTDSSSIVTGITGFTLSALTPCQTMLDIASSTGTFYSDYNQSGSGSTCQDASHTVSSMYDIFASISASFTTPRLLPNDAQ